MAGYLFGDLAEEGVEAVEAAERVAAVARYGVAHTRHRFLLHIAAFGIEFVGIAHELFQHRPGQ